MARVLGERIITSIDVGTTKICVFIAKHLHGCAVEIIGIGTVPSDGLSKGVVVDIPRAIHSISSAVKEAELMAGMQVESAYVGISGSHINSQNSQGVVPISRGAVTKEDIAQVLAAAQAIPIPEGQQIIHVLPQYFVIDGKERVMDPLDMHGIRLEVQAHIVLGSVASVQNLVTCCERAGVHVNDIILEQLASADAVLSDDERKLGVGVLDIGGGTSDFAVYHSGTIRYTHVIPIAGNHFTNDIAIGLRTTLKAAEAVKQSHGIASAAHSDKEVSIEIGQVHGVGSHRVTHADLARVLEPRAYELLLFVQRVVRDFTLHPYMATGLVLTGGGSLLHGLDEVAQDIFGMPVRVGAPRVMFDLPETVRSPLYATGYGMLIYVLKKKERESKKAADGTFTVRVFDRMKAWMRDFF